MNVNSEKPAYVQLKEYILNCIADESYKIGMRLPSERQFCELYSISRMTVRRALDELVQSGVLYRIQGSGTYISKRKMQHSGIMSFSEMAKNLGMEPSAVLLEKRTLIDSAISNSLMLKPETELLMIKRLRKANDSPIGIEQVFIPLIYCEDLNNSDLTGSFYKILTQKYSYKIQQMDITVNASRANKTEQELLILSKGAPVLRVEGVSYTDGLALLFQRSTYSGDDFTLNASITKRWS